MKKVCALSMLIALLAGCRTGTSVEAVYDSEFDFSKARTFDFLAAPAAAQTAISETSLLGHIEKAIVAKGLTRTGNSPDLLVSVHRSMAGSLNTKHSGYEVRSGRIARYTLQEGTLVIDLVTGNKRESVWRGTATGTFRDDLSGPERDKFITDVLVEMFADFPPAR